MSREERRTFASSILSWGHFQDLWVAIHLRGRSLSLRQYCKARMAAAYRLSSESASQTSSECSVVRPSVHRRGRGQRLLSGGGMCRNYPGWTSRSSNVTRILCSVTHSINLGLQIARAGPKLQCVVWRRSWELYEAIWQIQASERVAGYDVVNLGSRLVHAQ